MSMYCDMREDGIVLLRYLSTISVFVSCYSVFILIFGTIY